MILKPIKALYYKLRYDLPLWIDSKCSKPYIRLLSHKFFANSEEGRKLAILRDYEIFFGKTFDFENPQTLCQKLQWLKYHYNNPLMTQCADKYAVRQFVEDAIGGEYLNDLIGAYDSVNEIDFNALPNQFVLKVNWGSGQNIICSDKSAANLREYKKQLRSWLKPLSNHYYFSLESSYKDIKPKIICEKFLGSEINDYKIMCFNGEPQFLWVDVGRFTQHQRNVYDLNWEQIDASINYPKSPNTIQRPEQLDKMLELARQLASPFPFVRVDFYIHENKILFGELTFFPEAGLMNITPPDWDKTWGDLLVLPKD